MSAILTSVEAAELAARILAARYPEADAGLAAGSLVRGNAVAGSDLDLIVLFPALANARRESFVFEGVPVDVFAHDPATLRLYMQKDVDARKPAMLTMVREAVVVGPKPAAAEPLKAEAESIYASGPPPLDAAALDQFRYLITDRIGDLKDERPWPEMVATGAWLHLVLADFVLQANGRWGATAKWVPRALAAFDPEVEAAFTAAFEAFFQRRGAALLIAFAEQALAPFGGPLSDGYTAKGESAAKPSPESSSPAGAERTAKQRRVAANAGDP